MMLLRPLVSRCHLTRCKRATPQKQSFCSGVPCLGKCHPRFLRREIADLKWVVPNHCADVRDHHEHPAELTVIPRSEVASRMTSSETSPKISSRSLTSTPLDSTLEGPRPEDQRPGLLMGHPCHCGSPVRSGWHSDEFEGTK